MHRFLTPVANGLIATALLLSGTAQAQAKDDIVLGRVTEEAQMGTVDRRNCEVKFGGSTTVKSGDTVVVVRPTSCSLSFIKQPIPLYEIAFRGKTGLVSAESIEVLAPDAKRLAARPAEQRDKYLAQAIDLSTLLRVRETKEALQAFEKMESRGIAVIDYEFQREGGDDGATGFSMRVANPTKKTMRYVIATFMGLDEAKSPVRAARGEETVTRRGEERLAPDESAAFTWEKVWPAGSLKYIRWLSLKIEYTDGTSRTLVTPDDALLDPKHVRTLYDPK